MEVQCTSWDLISVVVNFSIRLSTNSIHRRGLRDSEQRTSEEYNRPAAKKRDEGTHRQDTPEALPKYIAVAFFFLVITLSTFMLFRLIEYTIDAPSS
jgi:hypothetical protein